MKKILIAEDSDIIRRRLVQLVEEIDGVSSVFETHDYASTVAAIKEERPKIILLDLFMPGGNGIDVLNEIKKLEQSPVVIVLTASSEVEFRDRAMEAGASYFFSKNVDFMLAIEVLRALASECVVDSAATVDD